MPIFSKNSISMINFVLIPIFAIFLLLLIFSGIFVVRQQTSAVVERFGKFTSIRNSGLQLKVPLIDQVAGRINLKVQQLDVLVETKTKDNVFVKLKISVQSPISCDEFITVIYV